MSKTLRMMTWGRKGMRYMSDMKYSRKVLDIKSDEGVKCALEDFKDARYPVFVRFTKNNGEKVVRELIDRVRCCLRATKLDPVDFTYLINTICTAYYSVDVLDQVEWRYLRDVIKPFRKRITFIRKEHFAGDYECLFIDVEDGDYMYFPNFKTGTMYKGMKQGKSYTLEELGL